MPKISQEKKDKIIEQILHYLFSVSPQPQFTASIAKNIARDEEFIKLILQELKTKNLIIEVNKNPKGFQYQRRQRWLLSEQVYKVFQEKQN
ncbi:MAG: hypothetical protein HYT79_11805 [Elusimicrobia bacterium]|nr:hypothetical protein [Elusimicrobiota bacterium]